MCTSPEVSAEWNLYDDVSVSIRHPRVAQSAQRQLDILKETANASKKYA
jgi:hypothetical protein